MNKKLKFRFSRKALAYPYMAFLILFVVVPLVMILINAFITDGNKIGFDNFVEFFSDAGGGLTVLGNSLIIGFVTTLLCLVIGYPVAYFLAKYHASNNVLVLMFILPMWVNFLIRTLSTKTIFLAMDLELGMGTVLFGMVYNYLPYMILPLYSTIVKINPRLIEAAEDLGCNSLQVFQRVTLPLSVPGILSGITMVFVPAVSTFYISQKLGGTDTVLIGDVIERQFKQGNNPNLGAALSLVLMILVFVCTGIMNRFGADEEGGVIA